MIMTLFKKECAQILKSLIFWLYVACLVLFFNSQMGNLTILNPPQEGQENYYNYGFKTDITEQDVMETGVGTTQYKVPLKDGISYEQFLKDMERVADILGPDSDYTEDRLWSNVMIPVDYEGAVENYRALTEQDGLTGGYARLFCDYMGIILGILPVFVTATRMLRDKRAQMQELIYSRGASSGVVMGTRYAALVFMHMIPVLILSLLPTVSCITAGIEGVQLNYLAWLKYDLDWLLPMVMIVVAVGMLCTELTETALAVLVQAVWWFMSVMTGAAGMDGGRYGWNLIHFLISAGLLAASPLILGLSNLDAAESAKVLETYVALIGIILFVPVFLPEQNRDLWELVKAKYMNITSVYLIRVGLSLLESALLVLVYIGVMHSGNCEMEVGRYFFGTMAEILAFGGLGIFAYAVSDNLIVGYMIPLGYYIAATGAGYKYLGKLYPFGMLQDFTTKYWILAIGILLMAVGLLLFRRKR